MTSTTNDPQDLTTSGTPPESRGAPGPANDPPEPREPHHEREGAPSDDVSALRHEAASRRRALRQAEAEHAAEITAVEAERDQLRQRVDQHERAAVERLAGGRLHDAADLWASTTLDDLRDPETGEVDANAIGQAVDDLIARKPHLARPMPPTADLHAGPRQTVPRPPSLGEAMKRQIGRRG